MNNPHWLRSDFAQSDRLRRILPTWLKDVLKRQISYADFRSEQLKRLAERRFAGAIPTESTYESRYPVVLGILSDPCYAYTNNVAACQDLGVRFRVLDISTTDWLEQVEGSGCDAFMATPASLLGVRRRMFEERLWVLSGDLRRVLCPTLRELFLWESKRRMHDWMVAHSVPHARTWVFHDLLQAKEFCHGADYPVVCKTDAGAASSGVFVLRRRRDAERMVDLAFSKGLLGRAADARDREWGSILFQEFVPHDFEWRIVRIGDQFLCRKKVRVGDYASGSGEIGWAAPLPGMLDFVRDVTELGGFRSMSVDLFENTAGPETRRYLVNELQAIIGFSDVPENENTGRWRLESVHSTWRFEPGRFHQNACANLRVLMLLESLVATQ